MPIDRDRYFDAVRQSAFAPGLTQDQVDGQNTLLDYWEDQWESEESRSDRRWLAYLLATTKWETASTMQPIEEYGKGEGKEYGQTDPETGQAYYGRGYVQLTWRENYARATEELGLQEHEDLEWNAAKALDPVIARQVIFEGMAAGWFTGKELSDYFSSTTDDPKNARQIINGNDKDDEIAALHRQFLDAVNGAYVEPKRRKPPGPVATEEVTVQVVLRVPAGTRVEVVGAAVVTPSS